VVGDDQPEAREGQAGRLGVAERFVVPLKPGNAGGGKGPQSRQTQYVVKDLEIGQPINSASVQKLQKALHAKAKARSLIREPDAGDLLVRFDERDVETESGLNNKAPPDERGGQQICSPTATRHIRLYHLRRSFVRFRSIADINS